MKRFDLRTFFLFVLAGAGCSAASQDLGNNDARGDASAFAPDGSPVSNPDGSTPRSDGATPGISDAAHEASNTPGGDATAGTDAAGQGDAERDSAPTTFTCGETNPGLGNVAVQCAETQYCLSITDSSGEHATNSCSANGCSGAPSCACATDGTCVVPLPKRVCTQDGAGHVVVSCTVM